MACGASHLTHFDEDRIGVAVEIDALELLNMTALLPFSPEPIATAREITYATGSYRLFERFAVHVGEHQHFAGGVILRDGGNDAAEFFKVNLDHRFLH